jgi:hypothetical protein
MCQFKGTFLNFLLLSSNSNKKFNCVFNFRYDLISHFNVQIDLRLASSYLLACTSAPGSGGGGGGTAKYAPPGELYAHLALSKDVSEDTCSGRLILNNCTTIFISPAAERSKVKSFFQIII